MSQVPQHLAGCMCDTTSCKEPYCRHPMPSHRYTCTLPQHHDGPHVACFEIAHGQEHGHNLAIWTSDGEVLYEC